MKYRFKHKTKGWTGTIEFHDLHTNMYASSSCSGTVNFTVDSDDQEDPFVEELDDIVLLSPQEECKHNNRWDGYHIAHFEDKSVCMLCKKEWPREEVEELTEDDFWTFSSEVFKRYCLTEQGRDKLIRKFNGIGKGEA